MTERVIYRKLPSSKERNSKKAIYWGPDGIPNLATYNFLFPMRFNANGGGRGDILGGTSAKSVNKASSKRRKETAQLKLLMKGGIRRSQQQVEKKEKSKRPRDHSLELNNQKAFNAIDQGLQNSQEPVEVFRGKNKKTQSEVSMVIGKLENPSSIEEALLFAEEWQTIANEHSGELSLAAQSRSDFYLNVAVENENIKVQSL